MPKAIKKSLVERFPSPEYAAKHDNVTERYTTGTLDSMGTLQLVTVPEAE